MKHVFVSSCAENGGIYRYSFENGELKFKEKTLLDCPMYTIIRDNKMHLILREINPETRFGGYLSFDIDENGQLINLTPIQSTNGIVSCHLEADGDDVFVANYLSGNIVKIGETTVTHSGSSVHPTRQTAPHTHFVSLSPDKQYLLCTDLGLDTVFVYNRNLQAVSSAKVPLGSGPRHLCFNNNLVYCVNELSNDISVFSFEKGTLTLLNTYKAIPHFKDKSTAAAIKLYKGKLYVSHRGANCISCFNIKGETLELLYNSNCGGNSPRDFEIIDNYIICTNEGGNVAVLKLYENGAELVGTIPLENPICVTYKEKI